MKKGIYDESNIKRRKGKEKECEGPGRGHMQKKTAADARSGWGGFPTNEGRGKPMVLLEHP